MSKISITEQQLYEFIKNPRTIKAFQQLFKIVAIDAPKESDDINISNGVCAGISMEAVYLAIDAAMQSLASTINENSQIPDVYTPPVVFDNENRNPKALVTSGVTMNSGSSSFAATLTNAPAAGNPTKWIPINDNGVIRYIPAW